MSTSIEHRQARILGVILAGGRGERLGRRDKALIEVDGEPLVARVARALSTQTDAVAITRQSDQADLSEYGVVIADDAVDQGPLAGVVAAANYAMREGFDFMVTAAVDSIAIPDDLLARLWAVRAPHAVLVSRERMQPTFALYDLAKVDGIINAFESGERAPKRALAAAGVGHAPIDATVFNINTLDDLDKLGSKGWR